MKLLILLPVMLLLGCASTKATVYDPTGVAEVFAWNIGFAYDSREVERSQNSDGSSELKVVERGYTPRQLQLRDDILFMLRDDYDLPVFMKPREKAGRIQLHSTDFSFGGFRRLTVTLYDGSGELVSRLKIKNGDRNATWKNDDKFARYAARAIAKAIQPAK